MEQLQPNDIFSNKQGAEMQIGRAISLVSGALCSNQLDMEVMSQIYADEIKRMECVRQELADLSRNGGDLFV